MTKSKPAAKTLKYYREAAGMTQQQLAQAANCSLSLIGSYETTPPKKIPGLRMAVKLADVLGVSLDDIAIAFGVRESKTKEGTES